LHFFSVGISTSKPIYNIEKYSNLESIIKKEASKKLESPAFVLPFFPNPRKISNKKKPTNQKHVDFLQVWKLNVATGRGACFWKDTA